MSQSSAQRHSRVITNPAYLIIFITLIFALYAGLNFKLHQQAAPVYEQLDTVLVKSISPDERQTEIDLTNRVNVGTNLPLDPTKLEILGQDIRTHPRVKTALLVNFTVINKAKIPQAYPYIKLSFSDINQRPVAEGYFSPQQYLNKSVNISAGMESGVPLQVEMEITDPGKEAVNYEFNFVATADKKINKEIKTLELVNDKLKPNLRQKTTTTSNSKSTCYSLGPFEGESEVKRIAAKLEELGATTTNRMGNIEKAIGYWVYLPSKKSWKDAREEVVRLEAKGLKDMFIMGRGEFKNAISLGLFKTEDAAKLRIEKIKALGVTPEIQTQYSNVESHWIDITVAFDNKGADKARQAITEGLTTQDLVLRKCN